MHTVLHSARGQLCVGTATVRCVMRPRRRRAGPGGARSGPWATRPKQLWSILACWSPWARPNGAERPSSSRKPAPSAAGRAARRAARGTLHFFARGRIAATRGMQAQPCRCASVSKRSPRWHPSKNCSAGPRAARDSGAQRVRPAAQRRRAGSGAPGSGCGRGLDGLQRGAPLARALSASCCAPRPAAAGRGGLHWGFLATSQYLQITVIPTLGHPLIQQRTSG